MPTVGLRIVVDWTSNLLQFLFFPNAQNRRLRRSARSCCIEALEQRVEPPEAPPSVGPVTVKPRKGGAWGSESPEEIWD